LLAGILYAEPEGYHFGAANGLGLAVWRNVAAAADDDDNAESDADDMTDPAESVADMDKIAFGFMTWQPNTTLLHCTSKSTGDMMEIKLVGFLNNFIDMSVTCRLNTHRM